MLFCRFFALSQYKTWQNGTKCVQQAEVPLSLLFLNVLYHIHYRSVAVHHDAYHLVAEWQRCGVADYRECAVAELLECDELQAGSLQAFSYLRASRVDSDAVFGYDHVYGATRSDERSNLVNDARYSAAEQRADDDREC